MAGQASRGSRGHGRSSRPGSSSPRVAAASAAGSGIAPTRSVPKRKGAPAATLAPATRSVYRLLLMKGLTPTEAASLTAFTCGLPASDLRWSLTQLDHLLFLRQMRQTGRFGGTDGGPARPH
jgi:hypothetical protein